MTEWQNQSHVTWYCRYHVVIVPKYRRNQCLVCCGVIFGRYMKDMCRWFGIDLLDGHVMPNHIHSCLGIPPKYTVANTIGKLKRKPAVMNHP